MVTERKELGAVVVELLEGPLAQGHDRVLLLLTWLRHVEGNLTKSTRYARSRLWMRENVDPVLALLLRSPAAAGAPAAAPALGRRPRLGRAARRPWVRVTAGVGGLALGLGLWLGSLGGIDPRAMSDIGLVSVLPPGFLLALLALTASFAALVHRRSEHPRLLALHLVALVAVLHATPAIVYGTLRYSWAWKHVGIVDYIERHGGVDTGIGQLAVYHNWPGFFGLDALATELAGLGDALGQAIWATPFFNLLNLAALAFLFTALTRDRRIVWLALWLFFIASWVGQDYYSPQAFAFFLYLVLLGVVVRWLDRRRPWALALAVALAAAIAVSHPLTAVMAPIALLALTLAGACSYRSLPLIAAGLSAGWSLTFAADFVGPNLTSTLVSTGLPWATIESSLTATEALSDGQVLVAAVARGLVVAVCVLAALGWVRLVRSGGAARVPVFLAAAPLALFATGDYDGEILFRIYLFALPFLAFLAAHAFLTRATARERAGAIFAVAACGLLAAFVVAHYGKERQYYFSPEEIAAARYVYTHAPRGALLIEGSRNYPGQFANYESFDYVPLSREPRSSQVRVITRPAAVLSEWMAKRAHSAAFLIITRSQKAEVEELGVMPPGSLDRIERALSASPRFEAVFRNRDAVVFAPAHRGTL
jgi:hypothetical protein